MMKNSTRKRRFLSILVVWAVLNPILAFGEIYRLQDIELINAGGYYRMIVKCGGSVTYAEQWKDDPPRLILYLRETELTGRQFLSRPRRGPISEIEAVQWKQSPPIIKITVSLTQKIDYRIKRSIDGLYINVYQYNKAPDSEQFTSGQWMPAKTSVPALQTFAQSTTIQNDTEGDMPPLLSSREPLFLDVKAADITNVLRLLAKQSNLNIVASRDVSGTVTVSLDGVPIKEALDMVVKANGYDYLIAGEVILVKPRDKFQLEELETKVYRLKYIDANNLRSTVSQVLSPQAKIQVFYHNFQPSQKSSGEGQQSENQARSSILIVSDLPANIKQLNAMISALDVPTPQIMIEAKLIEIAPVDDQKLGIDWSKAINAQIFQEVLLPSGRTNRYSAEVPLTGGSINYGTLKFDEYNAVINFLDSHTNSKLVSNPRILAMDNQEATISVGTNFPIPQINRGVGGQGDIVTFEYRDVNISLNVTPHVAEDETITLHVNPIIEEITGQVEAGENTAPITSKREVETVVNLNSDETMVIGGLIRESNVETVRKVWLLGDIPLLGNLFRNKEKMKKQTDLLIFITPRLIGTF